MESRCQQVPHLLQEMATIRSMTGAYPLEALLNVASAALLTGGEDLQAESAELFSLEGAGLPQWRPIGIGRAHTVRLASRSRRAQP